MRMKRTQKKDAVRNILRQKVSYISIIVIAMLAVMAYLGIAYSSDAISAQAARYYDRMHFRDAEVNFFRATDKRNPDGWAEAVAQTFLGIPPSALTPPLSVRRPSP